jgi:hypothetical protein
MQNEELRRLAALRGLVPALVVVGGMLVVVIIEGVTMILALHIDIGLQQRLYRESGSTSTSTSTSASASASASASRSRSRSISIRV